jgi:hypothetical protein
MKKLIIGCAGLAGLALFGLIAIVVIAAIGSARQSGQNVTPGAGAPTLTPRAATESSKPTAKPEPKPAPVAKIGDRVESAGVAITVNGVQRADSVGQLLKAKPGRVYTVADVTIETTGREKAPYNPLYFKVKDSGGFEYNGSLLSGENSLKSGELEQGGKVRGTVAFDVPSEAKGLVLSYQPSVIFGGYQTLRIALD